MKMKMRRPFQSLLICAFWSFASSNAQTALEKSETQLAEELSAMGCRVELVLADGKVWIDSVHASGKIIPGQMKAEPLSDRLFSSLSGLQRVRKLRLDVKGGKTDWMRLKSLAGIRTLRELEIFGRDLTDEAMPYVGALTNLESLRLWDGYISERGLAQLSELQTLKRLDLYSLKKLNRECFEAIAKLNELQEIRIYGEIEGNFASVLTQLPKLDSVAVGGVSVNTILANLKDVPTIKRVEISAAEINDVAANSLRAMKNLKVLKLESCGIAGEALPILRSLELRRLECVGMQAEVLGDFARGMGEGLGDLKVSK